MAKIKRRRKEKQPRKRRHFLRNLPLKWSFVSYVILCTFVAFFLSVCTASLFNNLQSDLYYKYDAAYRESIAQPADIVLNGEVVQEDGIWIYSDNLHNLFSEEDARNYELYGILAVFSVPVVCLLCIVWTGVLFYRRKLKAPMKLFDDASARIAAGDLAFTIAYDNRNEMGRLARSFELMRASLEEANREMWRMMEERKRLNSAFAHDLRTPLTVLKGYADYLLRYIPQGRVTQDKQLDTLRMMRAYVDRLEGYTLSMSRLQKLEEITPVPRQLPFAALADQLEGAAAILSGKATLHFTRTGGGSLCVDPALIVQVLENLAANAARYAASSIAVSCALTEDAFCLTVSDDGPGFSEEACRMAQAPYYHEAYADVDSVHFGIGLYVCALLCRKHGGALTLPSAPGSAEVTATFALLDAGGDQPMRV